MFLLILDKNPYTAAELVPDRLKFKQLLELGQLICSAGISDVFKSIKQGKRLQEWVKTYKHWTLRYFETLFNWAKTNLDLRSETRLKLSKIYVDLCSSTYWTSVPEVAIFRYIKEYKSFTKYDTNSELAIDIAIKEYRDYILWKEKRFKEALRRGDINDS